MQIKYCEYSNTIRLMPQNYLIALNRGRWIMEPDLACPSKYVLVVTEVLKNHPCKYGSGETVINYANQLIAMYENETAPNYWNSGIFENKTEVKSKLLKLCAYRGADYSAPSEAIQDGAFYTLIENVDSELLKNKQLMNQFNDIANKTEHCINDGMSKIELVWVDKNNFVYEYMFELVK